MAQPQEIEIVWLQILFILNILCLATFSSIDQLSCTTHTYIMKALVNGQSYFGTSYYPIALTESDIQFVKSSVF